MKSVCWDSFQNVWVTWSFFYSALEAVFFWCMLRYYRQQQWSYDTIHLTVSLLHRRRPVQTLRECAECVCVCVCVFVYVWMCVYVRMNSKPSESTTLEASWLIHGGLWDGCTHHSVVLSHHMTGYYSCSQTVYPSACTAVLYCVFID